MSLAAAGLVLAVIVAYLPSLHAGYIWDDPRYVTENPVLRSLDGLGRIWFDRGATVQYYPLVFTSFWVEYHLWGLHPTGYHVVNILIHAGNVVFFWIFLRRLGVPGAWVAACLFGLHPVQVESVAWITERKNVLSGLCYFAALLAYLPLAGLGATAGAPPRNGRRYALVLLLFLAALLSKTVTASLPAVILLLIWWQRGRLTWRDIRPTIPLFALGLLGSAITAWFERYTVRAVGEAWNLSLEQRFLIAGRAAWFYLDTLLRPFGSNFNYPRWTPDPAALWQWLFPISALALVMLLWILRRRVGRGPLTAALFFGGTLLPALGFFNTYPMRYSFVADHFQYLACLGPLALFTALAARALAKRGRAQRVVAGGVVLALLLLTNRYARVYQNEETLWNDVLRKNPDSFLAHNDLGALFRQRKQYDLAEMHFAEALRVQPRFYEALFNLGRIREDSGELDAALELYGRAQSVRPDKPDVYGALGSALGKQGRKDEALAQYQRALEVDPNLPWAHNNVANLLAEQGRYADALEHYDRSLRLNPDNSNTYRNRGHTLCSLRRFDDAIAAYREAVRRRPNDADLHCDLASTLRQRGDAAGAQREYEAALRIAPHHERALRGLGREMPRP